MADLDGRMVYVNPALCRLLGAEKPEELIGKDLVSFCPKEWNERRAHEILPALERDGNWAGEVPMLSLPGEKVATLHHVTLLRDQAGKPVRRAIVVTDITERKRAVEAVFRAKQEWERTFDSVPDLIAILDTHYRIMRVNQAMAQRMGLTPAQCVGLTCYESIHGTSEPPAECPYALLLADGKEHTANAASRNCTAIFWSAPLRCSTNRANSWAACMWPGDITAQKQAEAELRKDHRTLKHLLQSSDHERQLIAYEIHDGLAQQLAGAIMQFDTYSHQKEAKPQKAASAFRAAMTMLRQAHSEARRLISGVRPPILDESGIVAAVADLVNKQRLQGAIKIELHSDVEFHRLAPIVENAIYRIVQEGLANACRHSKSQRVLVQLVQQPETLLIKIQDWGVGFVVEEVEEDRFGLAGIRERTRLLGGKTILTSAPGEGTCLVVELPLVPEE